MTLALPRLIADVATQPTVRPMFPWPPDNLWLALIYVTLFGILGIVLTVVGFKVFDAVLKKVCVESELAEKHNVSVAIVVAAVILGISIVIAAAIG